MALDFKCLIESLKTLKNKNGRGFYGVLSKASGVANIGRYVIGDRQPTFDSWLALHAAFPDDIPPPCYKKESLPASMKSTGDYNRLVQASTYTERGPDYSGELVELVGVLDQYATKVEIRQLLEFWREKKRKIEMG